MSPEPLRVVVADDAVLLREGIRQLLTAGGCEVVASVGSPAELDLVLAQPGRIDAIVLDIRMPPGHSDEGIQVLERLRATGSTVGVLLLSMYASPALVLRAMACGAGTGYLLKERISDGLALVRAVRTVAAGGTTVDPEVVALLVGARGGSRLERLTAREREVLTLMAEGASNLGIAVALALSERTVESHVAHIMTKLDIEPSPEEHRRVLAVLRLLRSAP